MFKDKWLLLVEDDKDIQDSLIELLDMEGYSVQGVSDGAQALEALRAAEQPPALILLDLMMRGMSGPQFLEEQRKDADLQRIPVVIMSADGTGQSRISENDVDGFLRKPADIVDILSLVERYLGPPPANG